MPSSRLIWIIQFYPVSLIIWIIHLWPEHFFETKISTTYIFHKGTPVRLLLLLLLPVMLLLLLLLQESSSKLETLLADPSTGGGIIKFPVAY
jgi:hypothetical protein